MKKNYLLSIEYDGGRYSGWQRQGNTANTIEQKLSGCLMAMCKTDEFIEIHGSGRTDTGVHARGQIANVWLDTNMSTDSIKMYLNKYLPEDIRIKNVEIVGADFHARLSAKKKTYSYTLDVGEKADVFLRRYSWNLCEKLDIDKMKNAAVLLVGKYDFRSLSDMITKKSSVRTIYAIDINCNADIIKISYTGDGFLYHMVRKITALLVEIGAGRIEIHDVKEILDKRSRQAFKPLAPAKGLCLEEVFY